MKKIIILLLFVMLFSTGNGNEAAAETPGIDEVTTAVLFEQHQGKTTFTVKITNNMEEELLLTFPTGQKIEVEVQNKKGEELYRYSEGRMFTQSFEKVRIPPNETKQWTADWNTGINQLEPGPYLITGIITATKTEPKINEKKLKAKKVFFVNP
ncbi:BsuPI-related putative proteinase inhibitor [Pseudalkalibacillus caeni]|uniref:Intracellular proteinase inhibitor BsuPI domain-containing protein n=1 Tax=Exobacillus caeni TaxID=2574798 RepID=A0A5R9FAF8_9BACL|nr:BsuPI-related putative proteinase inhibitor [Pseudalkalibacillus caeni]TLS37853.1 hypothetical protein FCL54_08525 [Pseudalkalibacillus caeni]